MSEVGAHTGGVARQGKAAVGGGADQFSEDIVKAGERHARDGCTG
jgi:hypothetical protein